MFGSNRQHRIPGSVWLAAVLWVFVLSGCASLGKYSEPIRVSISDIQIIEMSLLEQLYAVTLRIQNSNEHPFTVRGGSFDLEINGSDFGRIPRTHGGGEHNGLLRPRRECQEATHGAADNSRVLK